MLKFTNCREIVVLYPKNGSRLEPSKVEGLDAKLE